jgi:hypothetical protein
VMRCRAKARAGRSKACHACQGRGATAPVSVAADR